MGNPSGDKDKGYWRLDPMGLVAGQTAYVDHGKEMAAWSHMGFMTRKLEDAPKDGALDDMASTGLKSVWERLVKTLRRIH